MRRIPLGRLRGLWFIEDHKRKVFLYGTDIALDPTPLADLSSRTFPLLDQTPAQVERAAKASAARVLGVDPAAAETEIVSRDRSGRCPSGEGRTCDSPGRVGRLSGKIDDEAFAVILRAEGAADVETYNHFWDADGAHRRNRIQAARSFLLLRPMRGDWRLRRAVDRGDPLARGAGRPL